ncbi:MAG: ABC transporter permease [Candidatus Krumholzibacteria bacterium]|jgi:ABC-2 type transport system permease protein|nr:ABC transporter permease [Candidatus Krumholzibacteria bacterium]
MKRIAAIAHKELIHILRDHRSLAVAVLMPLAMVLLYGSVIDMELRDLQVGVLDLDHSDRSRALVRAMTASGFIVEAARLENRVEVEPGFRQGRFRAVLVLPDGLAAGDAENMQILVDAADAATAATIDNYLQAVVLRATSQQRAATGAPPPAFTARTRIWFNPELESAHFVVPGLVALVMMMICALLTSIAITREKETGTLEQILSTPVAPGQVIVGKVLPYVGLAALDATLILVTGRFAFQVPMNGSWLALAAYTLLFIVIALGVGLLISARSSSLRVAMMAAIVVTMLPTMILSGFIFPIASMPRLLQAVCQVMPATHFLVVVRGIMLKGQNWFPLETAILALMAIVILSLAARSFRLRLE